MNFIKTPSSFLMLAY